MLHWMPSVSGEDALGQPPRDLGHTSASLSNAVDGVDAAPLVIGSCRRLRRDRRFGHGAGLNLPPIELATAPASTTSGASSKVPAVADEIAGAPFIA